MMKCRDLHELLSAYTDGELHQTQQDFIEEHLNECRECRDTLAGFITANNTLLRLRDTTEAEDITRPVMSRIKKSQAPRSRRSLGWVRPLALSLTALVVIAVLVIAQPWTPDTPEARAASIARSSPELKAALNGAEIKEVEVTTKLVDDDGNVWLTLVKTEERAVAAQVDLETEQVTEIIRVDVPDFQPGDEQKSLDIAKSDSRVQELLTQGGTIADIHQSYSIHFDQVTGPDGLPQKEGTVTPTVFITIELDGHDWNIVVDAREGTILSIGQSQPSAGMLVAKWSDIIYSILNPLMAVVGLLVIAGLLFWKKTAVAVTGLYAAAAGIIAAFGSIYAWPRGFGDQALALMVPVLGVLTGIVRIRRTRAKRWLPVTGIVFCALALAWIIFNWIMLPENHTVEITVVSAVIVALIVYALKDTIMKIKLPGNWLRPALIAVAAIIVLVLTLIHPWSGSLEPQAVLAETHAAIEELHSYRLDASVSSPDSTTPAERMEMAYSSPERYRFTITETGEETEEFIVIGSDYYVHNTDMSRNVITANILGLSSLLKKEMTLSLLDTLTGIEELPDESVDGIKTMHYRGELDIEPQIAEARSSMQEARDRTGGERPTDEEIERSLEDMRSVSILIDIWVGNDDYLLRQMTMEHRKLENGAWTTVSAVSFRFYDFNEPVVIEPPLDTDGQLLDGWQLAGSITPDSTQPVFSRNISSSIGAQDGYEDDWTHQQAEYSMTITNNSIETVYDMRVTVATMLTNEETRPAIVEAKPDLPTDAVPPGESRTFHAVCPFNASSYTKEDIIEMHEMAEITVHFTTEDGLELSEILSAVATYPANTPQPAE